MLTRGRIRLVLAVSSLLLATCLFLKSPNLKSQKTSTHHVISMETNATTFISPHIEDMKSFIGKSQAFLKQDVDLEAYEKVLSFCADDDKIIILSLVDLHFLDVALNFYETSIKGMGIRNYLFVGTNHQACETMIGFRINCYVYLQDKNAAVSTIYKSESFNYKMNIRTFMIIDALSFGYTVLHSDTDVIYFKNPLQHIHCGPNCDIALLMDDTRGNVYNAGFVYIRPTHLSRSVYLSMMMKSRMSLQIDDQTALNAALKKAEKTHIRLRQLPQKSFLNGLSYFEKNARFFAGQSPCMETCIVVHNNWIVSKEAKRYRFRETHLWMYDDQDQYYTDPSRTYLTFSNPQIFPTDGVSRYEELQALKTALYIGHVLNRTVILPRFHCWHDDERTGLTVRECPLNAHLHIATFDEYFHKLYRESTFLQHPRVPDVIKTGLSQLTWIDPRIGEEGVEPKPGVRSFTPQDPDLGPSQSELHLWFGQEESPVLLFQSLYNMYDDSIIPESDNSTIADSGGITYKLAKGCIYSTYRQL